MAKKKRKRRNPGKGSKFERDLCRDLSRWWTNGRRDDVFWRAAGSGSRARVRGKAGKSTYGQHGDISATDPIGDPLIDVFCIEAKTGYPGVNISNLLHINKNRKKNQIIEEWIEKCEESYQNSGSLGWMLIQRPKGREMLVYISFDVHLLLPKIKGRKIVVSLGKRKLFDFVVVRFEDFLKSVTPQDIVLLSEGK